MPDPDIDSWYQHAMAYAEMKWPHLAPHSLAGLADALATVTPLLDGSPAAANTITRKRAVFHGALGYAAR